MNTAGDNRLIMDIAQPILQKSHIFSIKLLGHLVIDNVKQSWQVSPYGKNHGNYPVFGKLPRKDSINRDYSNK